MKSKSMSTVRPPNGIDDVDRPRDVTYNVACHEWFTQGEPWSRTFPTIWVHRCSVAQVSFHPSYGMEGQLGLMDLPSASASRPSPLSPEPSPIRTLCPCSRRRFRRAA